MSSNTTRIAKNTLMLYFRQILIMLVSLYTVRVVLETLGAEDYGIYNVVAGVVTMFGFLSNAMATASQRYFSFELGRGDFEQLKRVFNVSLTIYVMIGVLVLLLAETAGLWFVSDKLVIPPERNNAALWVYQFSIVSFLFTILTMPYMALIIAHEDMTIYAYVSIAEGVLKLVIVFLLQFILLDKLQLYGILLCVVTGINTAIYRTICSIKYKECRFGFYWNKELIREIMSFTGWSMFGALTTVLRNQAVTILLNQFFNPVVTAARGIASQVNSAISSFSSNFSTALQSQIVKSYSTGDKMWMFWLISHGAKAAYFLLFLCALPLILEMPIALSLWLKNPPEYAVLFTRLTIIDVLINSLSLPLMTAARASGRIRIYETVLGSIQIGCFLITWVVLLLGGPAYSVMIVTIGISVVMFIFRLLILRRLISYPLRTFFSEVVIPLCMTTIASVVLPCILYAALKQSLFRFCMVTGTSIISACLWMYILGLNKVERRRLNEMIVRRLRGA
jgi:O-antigen/teichoic acid export membrane protein